MPEAARLALVHTGGTLVMRPGADGTLHPGDIATELSTELPVLGRIARVDVRVVSNLDSGDMQPTDWRAITRAVHDALSDPIFSGVIVTHGTDTMAYSASAVSLMLGPVPKPVVFTGAQHPLADVRSDARTNLIDACLLASLPVREVGVAFANRFFRAVRVIKHDAWAYHAFDSPTCPPLVDLGLDIAIGPHVRPGGPLTPLDDRLDERVLALRVFPGLDPAVLMRALDTGVRGLVLEAYGTGTMPVGRGSLIPALGEASRRGVPVVVVSQCPRGAVDLTRYPGGVAALEAGAIAGGEMTVEAALAKLMIGLGRYDDAVGVRTFFERDRVGERSLVGDCAAARARARVAHILRASRNWRFPSR